MRHRKKINHLGRKSAHRKSMIANMAASLILHKRIKTTLAKAKALRTYVEPIITRSKEDTTHSRRMVFRVLQNKEAVTELFREVSTKVAERPGGYTRIIKLGPRLGDSAEMALIELVDFNENLLGDKEAAKAKSTRRGRRGTKKKEDAPAAPEVKTKEETKAEETAVEEKVAEEVVAEKVEDVVEVAEEPVAEVTAAEEVVTEEVVAEAPVTDEAVVEEVVVEEAVAEAAPEEPAAEEKTETTDQAEEKTEEAKPEDSEEKKS